MAGRKKNAAAKAETKAKAPARNQRTLFDLGAVKKTSPTAATVVEDASMQVNPLEGALPGPSDAGAEEELFVDSGPSSLNKHDAHPPSTELPLDIMNPPVTPKKLFSIFNLSSASEAVGSFSSDTTHVPETDPNSTTELPPRSSPILILSSPPPSLPSVPSGTKTMPIVLDSPLKPAPSSGSRGPVLAKSSHPFFAPRPTKSTSRAHTPSSARASTSSQALAPFPRDQHVRDEQSVLSTPPQLAFGRRERKAAAQESDTFPGESSTIGLPPVQDNDLQVPEGTSFFQCPATFPAADRDRHIQSIPFSHTLHPAISRLLAHGRSRNLAPPKSVEPEQQLWADKWAPTRAEEVLGNEDHAEYLRDWLAALQLTSSTVPVAPLAAEPVGSQTKRKRKSKNKVDEPKKPTVLRAVVKRRGRKRQRVDSDDEDDWIAADDDDDIEEEPQVDYATSDDELRLRVPGSSAGTSEGGDPPPSEPERPARWTFDRLTNTILLSGPPGCGKTAAVHACALELGYEVFEVYPGVGKRSGANLESLIGDVGKNHTVQVGDLSPRKGRQKKAAPHSLAGLFSARSKFDVAVVDDDHGNMMTYNEETAEGLRSLEPIQSTSQVGQSLILLEEVDILYKDDVNFWPTVVDIIRDCKRPVIMTCNDHTLVPLQDLPLQNILDFVPCPSALATSYLHSLALAEGYSVERDVIARLAASRYTITSADLPDVPMHPFSYNLSKLDLRAGIHNLQLRCRFPKPPTSMDSVSLEPAINHSRNTFEWAAAGSVASITPMELLDQLKCLHQLGKHTDTTSFADSFLTRSPQDVLELASFDNYESSLDDEIGYAMLFKDDTISGFRHALPAFYTYDTTLFEDVARLSGRAVEKLPMPQASGHAMEALDAAAAFISRTSFQRQVVAALGELLDISAPLMPRPSVFLDYEPWIRYMVAVDDAQEATWAETRVSGPGRSGRLTRNSQRYQRWVVLADDLRGALAESSLKWG